VDAALTRARQARLPSPWTGRGIWSFEVLTGEARICFIVGSVKPFKGFPWFSPNAARGIAHATCAPRARL